MTIDDLIAFGADTQEGVKRCMNKEDFYLRMVKKVPAEPNFQKLYDSLAAGDLAAAFDAAHTIKGVAGNLSLTPIFTPASELTELLRTRTQADYAPLVDAIRKGRDELELLCSK
ncbi:MAG: Hpt domain-containing protein [Victivallales bacterium]|jgi:HPt (histidine-containing phosphotransfer) domain-containing protein|nr:Hpt domain-containing protein [Victivallales bacterium]